MPNRTVRRFTQVDVSPYPMTSEPGQKEGYDIVRHPNPPPCPGSRPLLVQRYIQGEKETQPWWHLPRGRRLSGKRRRPRNLVRTVPVEPEAVGRKVMGGQLPDGRRLYETERQVGDITYLDVSVEGA